MPSQQSVSVTNVRQCPNDLSDSSDEELSDDEYLLLLRKKECLAYHHICGVFRAQGHLTPEKLKLLKEIASALGIPEVRHKAECSIVASDSELSRIAECVAGPNTDEAWMKEAMEGQRREPESQIKTAHSPLVQALVRHVERTIATDTSRRKWSQIVTLTTLMPKNGVKNNTVQSKSSGRRRNVEVKQETINLMTEEEIKEEELDGESSSSVSTTSGLEDLQPEKDENLREVEKRAQPELDLRLMPPPSPVVTVSSSLVPPSPVFTAPHTPAAVESLPGTPTVITVPPSSSILTLPPSPAVITVPPSSSILTLPSNPAVITVPPSSSILTIPSPSPALITVPPPTSLSASSVPVTPSPPVFTTPPLPTQTKTCKIDEATPVLSDELQFVSLPESMDSSLPPLVVVPPPEPVISVPHSPTLIIPPGMSIQLREECEELKKRKRSVSQDRALKECSATSPKTMNVSHISKMTPVMVSVANVSTSSLKVTPTISRAKVAVSTQSSLSTSTHQKVIIVPNAPSSCAPMIQHSLNIPMRGPFIRTTRPRLHPTPVSGGVIKVRPRMVTVPAKCRAKNSQLVIPVSGHNVQFKNSVSLKKDNVIQMDASDKKKVLLGSVTPTKILPKPQTSMFVVNTSQGTQKIPTSVALQAGGQTPKVLSPRVVEGAGPKQMVIVQKGSGKQQRVMLTNTSKDLMQKLISKKCVVIQSPKALPKTLCPKPSPPAAFPVHGPSTSGSNVVVLDLSQEQYRQNLSSRTLAEILQASGILAVSSATPTISTTSHTTSVSGPGPSSKWLSMEAGKSLAMEEVTLPLGQTESVVTLDEAVQLLGEPAEQQVEVASHTDPTSQLYTIASDMNATNMIVTEMSSMEDLSTSQIVPTSVQGEHINQQRTTHRDGAVTIQHSSIDVPENMSLEEYSSQQLENQSLS